MYIEDCIEGTMKVFNSIFLMFLILEVRTSFNKPISRLY